MQAIRSTRPGGHVGFVGVSHDVQLPGDELFFSQVHLHGGPAPVRRFLPDLIDRIWNRADRPGQGLRPRAPARRGRRGLPRHGRAPRHQGAPPSMTSATKAVGASRDGHAVALPCCSLIGCQRAGGSDDRPAQATTGRRANPVAEPAATPPPPRQCRDQGGKHEDRDHHRRRSASRATLDDSAASRDLLAQLPQTVEMRDHGGVEKTGPLRSPLSPRRTACRAPTPTSVTSATTPQATTSSSTTATSPTTTGSSSSVTSTAMPPSASRGWTATSSSRNVDHPDRAQS